MPKLEKVNIEKNEDGKITYTYKKTDLNPYKYGHFLKLNRFKTRPPQTGL